MVQDARSLKSSCWQGSFLLEALREKLPYASLLTVGSCQQPGVLGFQVHHVSLCLCVFTWPSLFCVYVPSSSYKDTSH